MLDSKSDIKRIGDNSDGPLTMFLGKHCLFAAVSPEKVETAPYSRTLTTPIPEEGT